jgi:hypothetical protein
VVFNLIRSGSVKAKVLQADSPWFGVTYPEDKPYVIDKIRELIHQGFYPENLWQ